MKEKSVFGFENDELEFQVIEDIAVIKHKERSFEFLSEPEKTGQFITLCEWVERDPMIKALIMFNEPNVFDDEGYHKFLSRILDDGNGKTGSHAEAQRRLNKAKQLNNFRSFVLKMIDYKKIYVSALSGTIVTPIFGLSLTADFRFASEDMQFSLSHERFGVHPSGGLPFLLPMYVGNQKAHEILIGCDNISADEAKRIGLVNEVFPKEDFFKKVIEKTSKLADKNQSVIKLTKRLACNYKSQLEEYFRYEAKMVGI
jgi:enoyl-CoA hydratase/carnithine racemase